ncbi:MAG: hypothetical protein AB1894_13990 [Chloroflexota bacterium]
MKKAIYWLVTLALVGVALACAFSNSGEGETELVPLPPTTTVLSGTPVTILPTGLLPTKAWLPVNVVCQFTSQAGPIAGWYWLKDDDYQAYVQWECRGLPAGESLPLVLVALVTNQDDGGSGYSTPVKVTYTNPSSGESQAVQVYLQNPLPAADPANSRGQGYLASGYVSIPARYIDAQQRMTIRLERSRPNPYHIAANAATLRIVPLASAADFVPEGNSVDGWYWIRAVPEGEFARWIFHGLDANADLSVLVFDVLVTQGENKGSGYSMPLKVTLTNPASEERLSLETVIAQNLLFTQDPVGSQGAGYQTYASLIVDKGYIDANGDLIVRVERPTGSAYHLAARRTSAQVAQFGGTAASQSGVEMGTAIPAVITDQASCEALGGKWGTVGPSPYEVCNLPTSDAGKLCTDSDACESGCVADLTQEQFDQVFRQGAVIRTNGQCAAWHILVGCIPFVEDGVVQIICMD